MPERLHTWCFWLLLFLTGSLRAQNPTFREFTIKDGLPSNNVYHVIQDREGYIWFATDAGVSRYDGYEFRNFTTEEGVPDNDVLKVFEDRRGRVWFATMNGKPGFYEKGRIYNSRNHPLLQQVSMQKPILNFYQRRNGELCILTQQNAIWLLEEDLKQARKLSLTHNAAACWEMGDTLFIGGTSLELTRIFEGHSETGCIPLICGYNSQNTFVTTHSMRQDAVLIHTVNMLLLQRLDKPWKCIAKGTSPGLKTYQQVIYSITAGEADEEWLCTSAGAQIYHLQNGVPVYQEVLFPNMSFTCHLMDREHNHWFTHQEGVYLVSNASIRHLRATRDTPNLSVRSLHSVPGTGVVAGIAHEQLLMIPDTGKPYIQNLLPGNSTSVRDYVHTIQSRGDRIFFMGQTFYASSRQDLSDFRIDLNAHELNRVRSILPLPDSSLLCAGRTGILVARNLDDLRSKNFTASVEMLNRISATISYYTPRFGALVSTQNGLYQYRKPGIFPLETLNQALGEAYITDMTGLPDSTLFLATNSLGLLCIFPDTVLHISRQHGLSSVLCNSLFAENDSILWVCTNNGLNRIHFHADPGHPYTLESYFLYDGLAENDVKCLVKHGDQYFAGTSEGISIFREHDLRQRPHTPPLVYITQFRIFNQDTLLRDSLSLPWDMNNISLQFRGLSYRSQRELDYRFRLIYYNDAPEWTYTQNNEVNFPSLYSGEYRFEVQARAHDGTWSAQTAAINFTLRTPIWRTTFFYIAIPLIITLTLLSIFLSVLKVRRRQAELQQARSLSEQRALRAQMNPHFIFNSLAAIQRFIINQDRENALHYIGDFGALMRKILENSREETISLAEEIEFCNLYLEMEALRTDQSFTWDIQVHESLIPAEISLPPMLLQPLLENAIWHGILPREGTGHILMEFLPHSDNLLCVITDNGVGREKATQLRQNRIRKHKSLGMDITRDRIRLLFPGREETEVFRIMDLKDDAGNALGTRIEMEIPLNQEKN